MDLPTGSSEGMPFPPVSQSLAAAYDLHGLTLHRFGSSAAELAIDFARPARPHLITEILACCARAADGEPPDRRFLWSLPVGKRIECLLIIASLDSGGSFFAPVRCPNPPCGEQLEVDLALAELLDVARDSTAENIVSEHDGRRLTIRRPTGADQLSWLQESFADKAAATRAMIETLIVGEPEAAPTDDWIELIEEALHRHDPFVQFNMTIHCAECRKHSPVSCDLAELVLRQLQATQARLIAEVHELARHYHWSESEIVAIPPWRRARYLSLTAREGYG